MRATKTNRDLTVKNINAVIEVLTTIVEINERKFAANKERAIVRFMENAWFGKSRERAERLAFDTLSGTYHYQPRGYSTYKEWLTKANHLLRKWDCANHSLHAKNITLEDAEIRLLSVDFDYLKTVLADLQKDA